VGDFVREQRERENKQTYLLCFLKQEERGRERVVEEEEGVRETLAPPLTRVFKTDPTFIIYKILKKTLVL
jgi:hypothetical protein